MFYNTLKKLKNKIFIILNKIKRIDYVFFGKLIISQRFGDRFYHFQDINLKYTIIM